MHSFPEEESVEPKAPANLAVPAIVFTLFVIGLAVALVAGPHATPEADGDAQGTTRPTTAPAATRAVR